MPSKRPSQQANTSAAASSTAKPSSVYIDERHIAALRQDPRNDVAVSDGDPTATGFRLRKQGNRLTFRFMARNPDGQVVNVLIGQVGVISLSEARERAREMRRQIADGQCPKLEKAVQQKRQKAKRVGQKEARVWTIRKAMQSKLDDPTLRDGSKNNYRSLLNVSLASVADRRLDDISRLEWKALLARIKKDVSAAQASKVRAMAAALYRQAMAESENLVLANPLAELRVSMDDGSGQRRQGRIDEDDLQDWMVKLGTMGNETMKNLAVFTLMTAMREAEARLLRWDEIVGDQIVIPASRVKVRKELKLPITNAMWAVLEKQKGKNKTWVFPSPVSRTKPISPILPQMKQLGLTAHDLRRTALSMIDAMGVPQGVRLAIANHAPGKVADGYLVATQDDVFNALTRYHTQLSDGIRSGRRPNLYGDKFGRETDKSEVWAAL